MKHNWEINLHDRIDLKKLSEIKKQKKSQTAIETQSYCFLKLTT